MGFKIKFSDGWAKRYSELLDMFGLVGLASTYNDVKYYTFGTIEGICLPFEDGRLDIIAIFNSCPHNGHFELFMQALEKWGRNKGKVRICSFFNDRLYRHIKARGNWVSTIGTMDDLVYIPEQKRLQNETSC